MWARVSDRKHDWLLLFAAPMSVWGIHIVLLAPTQWAINSTLDMTIINVCGLLSCALSVLVLIWGHQLTVKGADAQRALIVEKDLDLEAIQHPWKARKAAKNGAGSPVAAAEELEKDDAEATKLPSVRVSQAMPSMSA